MTGDAIHKAPRIGRRAASHVARMFAAAWTISATYPALAGSKHAPDWSRSTTVETPVAGGAASNSMCESISSNLGKRVANIKALRVSYDKAAAGPPSSVQSALEGMFGTRQPDAKMRDIERKIKVERKSADELNEMLRSQRCAPVDIESALAAQPAQDSGGPVVPKDMPDDLVQTPRQY